jgi:regulator of protease activity HflC (stomatin/prohibitin superfamily)
METVVSILIAVAVAAIVLWLILRAMTEKVTVYEWERALRYRKGHLVDVVGPGSYRYLKSTRKFEVVDMRAAAITIAGQELVTSDGATIKLSLAVVYRVVDPKLAKIEQQSAEQLLYLELQLALRSLVTQRTIDELLESRASVGKDLVAAVSERAKELGLELISAELKDVSLPAELRHAYAQTVQARKEGQAALERARGETAALRNLANAAGLLADKPELMQLRLLQQLESLSGHTLVFGMPPDGIFLRGMAEKKR